MAEKEFLDPLEDLTGKIAIVTGGSQGIGLQTTILLARLGATVYICSLDNAKDRAGVAFAQEEIKKHHPQSTGSIHFHELDLSSISSARRSAEEFKKKIRIGEAGNEAGAGRLDIVIGNAGIAFPPQDVLSEDGVERTFAVNCLGHFVFITSLLGLIEPTASSYGEARITLTSSHGYKVAKKLDYTALTTRIPNDGSKFSDLGGGFQRYLDSKLAVLYLALALDQELWNRRGWRNVFVNACHPGNVPKTEIGNNQQPKVNPKLQNALKSFLGLFMRNSASDAAKTQVFLSSSKTIREKSIHGEYWAPVWKWQKYVGSAKEELRTGLARDEGEWKRLWDFCEDAVAKAGK